MAKYGWIKHILFLADLPMPKQRADHTHSLREGGVWCCWEGSEVPTLELLCLLTQVSTNHGRSNYTHLHHNDPQRLPKERAP